MFSVSNLCGFSFPVFTPPPLSLVYSYRALNEKQQGEASFYFHGSEVLCFFPVLSCLVFFSCLVLSCLRLLSCPVVSCRAVTCLVLWYTSSIWPTLPHADPSACALGMVCFARSRPKLLGLCFLFSVFCICICVVICLYPLSLSCIVL
jgi:hypothetical protein